MNSSPFKLSLVIFLLFSGSFSFSQSWIYLGSDTSGDAEGAGPDIDSVYYAIDELQDSIWFRITTNSPLDDYGFYIFIDADQNISNGFNLSDVPFGMPPHSSPNTSMMFDNRFVVVSKTTGFSDAWTEEWTGGGGSQSSVAEFIETSSTSVEVRAQLSDVDLTACVGDFNCVVVGGVSFFGQISDYSPDNTYYTANSCSVQLTDNLNQKISAYPNPCTNTLKISLENSNVIASVEVIDMLGGKHVVPFTISGPNITLETEVLAAGMYIARINLQQQAESMKVRFVKE